MTEKDRMTENYRITDKPGGSSIIRQESRLRMTKKLARNMYNFGVFLT